MPELISQVFSRPRLVIAGSTVLMLLLAVAVSGCGEKTLVKVDGSSTVFPVNLAMAEEFQKLGNGVYVTVGISGTGGGFNKLCNGEIDVSGASRPIKPVEVTECAEKGVEYIELPIAFDGLSVMVHPDNDWVDFLTVEELKRIWEPGSDVGKWSDVRPQWPGDDIFLVGADTDSGTFDYFTKAIVGEEGASRADYTASTDDNVLVTAIGGDSNALGYFGFAFYIENTDRLKLVPVDPGTGPVTPDIESIGNNTYQPLSRPLFIYVDAAAVQQPHVRDFVRFYLDSQNLDLVADSGYVPLPENVYQIVRQRFEDGVTGSVFGGKGSRVGISIEEVIEGR